MQNFYYWSSGVQLANLPYSNSIWTFWPFVIIGFPEGRQRIPLFVLLFLELQLGSPTELILSWNCVTWNLMSCFFRIFRIQVDTGMKSMSFIRVIKLLSYWVDWDIDNSNLATPRIFVNESKGSSCQYPPTILAHPTHIDWRLELLTGMQMLWVVDIRQSNSTHRSTLRTFHKNSNALSLAHQLNSMQRSTPRSSDKNANSPSCRYSPAKLGKPIDASNCLQEYKHIELSIRASQTDPPNTHRSTPWSDCFRFFIQ